jgi:hypothetical protein
MPGSKLAGGGNSSNTSSRLILMAVAISEFAIMLATFDENSKKQLIDSVTFLPGAEMRNQNKGKR